MDNRKFQVFLDRHRSQPFKMGNPLSIANIHQSLLETDRSAELFAEHDQLARHIAVLGVSGSGKSKLLELFCRHLIDTLNGFTFIDPHGDTAEALAAYASKFATEHGDESILSRFHYLKPSADWCFAFDPFRITMDDVSEDRRSMKFATRRQAAVDRMQKIFLRAVTEAEQEIMLRLSKWLSVVLTTLATPFHDDGRRLSIADAFVILDPEHPRHNDVYLAIRDRLPSDVVRDLDKIRSIHRPQDRDHYTESTDHQLRKFLKPVTKAIFGHEAPSINLREIVANRQILIVNLKETDDLSREASKPIAGLLIREIMNVCATFAEQGDRTPHHLIVDEAGEYLGEDFGDILEEARKYKLSLCLGAQTLASLRKGENVEIVEELESHCKTVISFQQRTIDDVERLGKYFGYPNYCLSERYQVMDRPDPSLDEIKTLKDRSESHSVSNGEVESVGVTTSKQSGEMSGAAKAEGVVASRSKSRSQQQMSNWSQGSGSANSSMHGIGGGTVDGFQHITIDGQLVQLPTMSHQNSIHDAFSNSLSDFSSRGGGSSEGESEGNSVGQSATNIQSVGNSKSTGVAHSESHASIHSESQTTGVTIKQQLVHRTREEWHPTGQPRYAIPYQNAMHEFLLTTLPDQYAFLRSKVNNVEQTCIFRVADVLPVFNTEREQLAAVAGFLDKLYPSKPYMFVPTEPDEAQRRRLNALVGEPRNQRPDGTAPATPFFPQQ